MRQMQYDGFASSRHLVASFPSHGCEMRWQAIFCGGNLGETKEEFRWCCCAISQSHVADVAESRACFCPLGVLNE